MVPLNKDILKLLKLSQSRGVKFVFDCDDDLSNEYKSVIDKEASKLMFELLHSCNALTVSTPYLRAFYGKEPAFVLPNHINSKDWEPFLDVRKDETLTIGITGSATHVDDWKQLSKPLHEIANDYKHVNFFIGGFVPEYLKDLPRVTYYEGFLPYDKYPGAIRQIDIGLAALDGSETFNLGKSGIKAIEYMASVRRVGKTRMGGAIPVVSNHSVYRRVIRNRVNGMLVDRDNWYNILSELIEDEQLRNKLSVQGYKWVLKNRSTNVCVRQWISAYHKISRL